MIFVSLVMLAITLLYVYHKYNYGYFRRRRVPGPRPLPIIGNMWDVMTQNLTFIELIRNVYSKYDDIPYFGFYRFLTPVVIVRDKDLAKKILIQDFDYFQDNDVHGSEDQPLISKNLFLMKGDEWRRSREKVAPLLSSGKIRQVFPLMIETCDNLVKHIRDDAKSATGEGLETRELSNRYTTDVVASCAFGLNANCLSDPDAVFREMGRKIFEPTAINSLKLLLSTMWPSITNFIDIHFIPPVVTDWIIKVVKDTVQYRRENNIKREDFLQALMQLHDKSDGKDFTLMDIAAQCTSFLLDGFETSGSILCLALYELARNPDVQERILSEAEDVLQRHDGQMTYDAMIELTYADAVINEAFRKWPLGAAFMRRCTKEYELPPYEGGPKRGFRLKQGDSVMVPISGFFKDHMYFSNPDMFDPTRFLEGGTITKDAFYPWGAGPRMCIGQRFAQLQTKASLVAVVRAFRLSLGDRMSTDKAAQPKLDPKSLLPRILGGTWITYTPREEPSILK